MDLAWCMTGAKTREDFLKWIYRQVNVTNESDKIIEKANQIEGSMAVQLQSIISEIKEMGDVLDGSNHLRDHISCNILNMMSTWQNKNPENWDNADILDWIYFTAGLNDIQLSSLRGENFQGLTGKEFCKMTREDFMSRDPGFGNSLYNSFVSFVRKRQDSCPLITSCRDKHEYKTDLHWSEFSICHGSLIPATVQTSEEQDASDSEFNSKQKHESRNTIIIQANKKKRRKFDGSPKRLSYDGVDAREISRENLIIGKRKHSSKILLSDFMRDLLESPEYNPSCVRWEDKERGIFRIISGKSKVVAELWGKIKNNPKMTFEKMGRSLRLVLNNKIFDIYLKLDKSTS